MPVRERGRVLASFWTLSREIGKHWSQSVHRETDTGFIDELRRTCESTNINFLLGAGCSMPAFGTSEILKHYGKTKDKRNKRTDCQ